MLLVTEWIPGEASWECPQYPACSSIQTKKKWFFNHDLLFFFSVCHHFLLINPPFLFSTFVRSETCKSGLMKLISVSIGQQTKGAYQCYSFQIPPCFSPQKKSIRPSESIMERPLPPRPTISPLHRWLLYLIEIETSIKIGLLHGTKESDIPQWRILLWVKPLDLIILIFHLR